MKTIKKVNIELVEVEFIPEEMEEGKLYYSKEYSIANHLCACGCKEKKPIKISKGHWDITNKNNLTIVPSLQHTTGCMSHYIITNGVANIV